MNVAEKLIKNHLISGHMKTGEEIGLKIDQTLTQDATGTLVMLEFEAMGLKRVETELSVQYVDHNLLQVDYKNADDHLFLYSACRKFGIWYSRPGNGVSHVVHMERFGIPGKTMLGSDSHTPAAGSLGMLAIGAGGLEVAMAMAGEPFYLKCPSIWGVKLTGQLQPWVSAKDIILEMLRRHGVNAGLHKIIEYYGPALKGLSAMDRHVIANMGAELGATTTVFPSDSNVEEFLKIQGRQNDFQEILADGPEYDEHEEINLSDLEPLIACPPSPAKVVPVREIAGREIYQSYIGSSANPGLRDFVVPAMMVEGRQVQSQVSFDVNPTSRQIFESLVRLGSLEKLIHAGARIHQTGCNGCIGMGQAPATNRISLRTVPRNFPGRSGTKEDQVYLCSPETATASALTGVITDPRTLKMDCPVFKGPSTISLNTKIVDPPVDDGADIELEKGPNIQPLPQFEALPSFLEGPVLLKVGDNISTDEILPAGAKVLPFRSNIQEISKFAFSQIDKDFYDKAIKYQKQGFFILGGENYGQGSSREHAALAPRFLGLKAVIAKSFARIHWRNLVNFGILPLTFKDQKDYEDIGENDMVKMSRVRESLQEGNEIEVFNVTKNKHYLTEHSLTSRHKEMILQGGLINMVRKEIMIT